MLQPLLAGPSAVSEEATFVRGNALQLEAHYESSLALFGAKARLLEALRELAEGCMEDDWDGYGAKPVTATVVTRAKIFIRALPDRLPLPEVSAEPDGAIAFDWMPDQSKTLSVSVSERSRVAWASVDGAERNHGAVPFTELMPSRIVLEIERITGHGATFRAA